MISFRQLHLELAGGTLIAFCEGIQAAAPVDSYVTPEPWDMPGYDSTGHYGSRSFCAGIFH